MRVHTANNSINDAGLDDNHHLDSLDSLDIKKQRPDIAKLNPQKLSYIANKGVVKRAQKAIEQGDMPTLHITDELTITASFADGSIVNWAQSCGIYDSTCSCPARQQVLCRHQIQTALAYRHYYYQNFDATTLLDTPAYMLTAKQISSAVDHKTSQQALRILSKSSIDIVLSFTDNDPCAMARLSMATVHFWGGNALHECTCDCKLKLGCEHILLAAIAFAKQSTPITTPITVNINKTEAHNGINGIDINHRLTDTNNAEFDIRAFDRRTFDNSEMSDIPHNATASVDNKTRGAPSLPKKTPPRFTLAELLPTGVHPTPSLSSDTLMPNMLVHTLSLLTDNEKLLFTQGYRYGISGSNSSNDASNSADATYILIEDIYQDNKKQQYLWLNDILLTLKDWLTAYRTRRSDFDLAQGNALISEYLLRRLAGAQPELANASLGVGIKAQTDMQPMQLMSLGCSLSVYEGNYHAQTLLLDNKTQTPLLLSSTWQLSPTDANAQQRHATQSSSALNPIIQQYIQTRQQRIAATITLAELQHGQLSTQRSRRSANHSITLNTSRRAYNQLMPYRVSAEMLAALPTPLAFQSIPQLRHFYSTRPLSFVRARHQQPNFVILPFNALLFMGYDPAQQTLGALIQATTDTKPHQCTGLNASGTPADTPYWIKLNYRSHSPFALALLAETFGQVNAADKTNPDTLPHHVSGTLSWEHFGDTLMPVITPWSIFCHDRNVVLALDMPEYIDEQGHQSAAHTQQVTGNKNSSATAHWQGNPALSKLPLVDFAQHSSDGTTRAHRHTSKSSIANTLINCKNWLDEALMYGAESVPNRFWQTQRQLIMQAQQAGLKQLAVSLKRIDRSMTVAPTASDNTKSDTHPLSMSEYLLMLNVQLAVLGELTIAGDISYDYNSQGILKSRQGDRSQ